MRGAAANAPTCPCRPPQVSVGDLAAEMLAGASRHPRHLSLHLGGTYGGISQTLARDKLLLALKCCMQARRPGACGWLWHSVCAQKAHSSGCRPPRLLPRGGLLLPSCGAARCGGFCGLRHTRQPAAFPSGCLGHQPPLLQEAADRGREVELPSEEELLALDPGLLGWALSQVHAARRETAGQQDDVHATNAVYQLSVLLLSNAGCRAMHMGWQPIVQHCPAASHFHPTPCPVIALQVIADASASACEVTFSNTDRPAVMPKYCAFLRRLRLTPVCTEDKEGHMKVGCCC